MIDRIVIRPEAEGDLGEAFDWYEEKRSGLGIHFLLQVDAGLQFLRRHPGAHPTEYKGARKHLIRRFPYKIIYLVEADALVILAVIHAKRNPDTMHKRVDQK